MPRYRTTAWLLALSAGLNVLAPLGFEAYYQQPTDWDVGSIGYWVVDDGGRWNIIEARHFGFSCYQQFYTELPDFAVETSRKYPRARGSLPAWIHLPPQDPPRGSVPPGHGSFRIDDVAYGWPFRAMQGWGSNVIPNPRWIPMGQCPKTKTYSTSRGWHPIWRGLALNTLITFGVAIIPYAGFHLVRAARAFQRRRKGVCIHCGYPKTGLRDHACPECGREYEPVISRQPDGSPAPQP